MGHTVRVGRVATAAHRGPYGGLEDAHAAILQFCKTNGHQLAGPSWDIYGHWNADPAQLRTDVFHLLKP